MVSTGDNLSAELNLVPFIDLLSTLVSFLLITAVWVKIGTVPAAVESKGSASTPAPAAPDKSIEVHVSTRGFTIKWPGGIAPRGTSLPSSFPKGADDFAVKELSALFKSLAPLDKATAAVTADDAVPYGVVVRTVDAVKQGTLKSVALGTY